MARIGEGDARWIVDQRSDGTNVHNWHWAEKDVLSWAQRRLAELLGDLQLVTSDRATLRTAGGDNILITGEAFVNNRKNKLIPSYELEVKGLWQGSVNQGGPGPVEVQGRFELPYIADENSEEDPELKFTTAREAQPEKFAKQQLLQNKEELLRAVRTFVKELRAGGPITRGAAPKTPAGQEQSTSPAQPEVNKPQAQASPPPKGSKPTDDKVRNAGNDSGGSRSLKLTERFYARPRDLYQCFTDAGRVQGFTQSPAKVVPQVGGCFEIFGGAVVGTFTQLQEFNRIALDWRFRNWEESAVSKVVLEFQEPQEGTTIVNLRHTGIPESDRFGNGDVLDNTRSGWQQQIFHKIRAVFGFGL